MEKLIFKMILDKEAKRVYNLAIGEGKIKVIENKTFNNILKEINSIPDETKRDRAYESFIQPVVNNKDTILVEYEH